MNETKFEKNCNFKIIKNLKYLHINAFRQQFETTLKDDLTFYNTKLIKNLNEFFKF